MKEESKRDKVALAMSPTLDTMWSFDPNSNKSNKSEKRVLFDDEVDFKPELKMESTAERSKSGKKRKGCDIDGEVIDMTGGGFEHGRKKKKKKKKKQRKRHLDETEEQYLFGGFAGTGYKSTFIEAALPIENGGNDSDQFNYEAEDEAQNSEEVQQDKNCESSDEAKEEEKYEKKKQHSKDTNVPGSNSQVTIPPITHKETPIPLPKLLSTGSALKPAIKKKSSFTEALAAAKQRMISPSPPWVGPNVKDRESPNSEMLKNKVYEPLTESESSLAGLTATQISRNSGSTTPAVRKVTPIPPPKLLYLQKKSILPGAAAASDRPSTLSNEPVAFATPPPPATAPKAISRIDNNGSHNIASTVSPATLPTHQTKSAEWETCSGTIRGIRIAGDLQRSENIAFAAQYVFSRPNGVSLGTTKFQVIQLGPSKKHTLSTSGGVGGGGHGSSKSEMICSVATGRVEVRVEGEKFSIGEHGMWRVRGGEGCVVRNKGDEEAVVHITALDGS